MPASPRSPTPKAMVLAAGFGTRLRPLTQIIPKPMIPVMHQPLLAHTLNLLRATGITDITVNLHHLPEHVTDHFGDGSRFGIGLHYSREEKILGTAGGIKAAERTLTGGTFIVINSDILVDIDLKRVLDFHRKNKSCLTLVVRQDAAPEKYDPIEMRQDGRIVHFIGASSMEMPDDTTRVMFTGIQIMEPDIFERIPAGQFSGTAQDIFPEMIRDGLPVYGYLHGGYWKDLGNRETYLEVHKDILDGRVSVRPPVLQAQASTTLTPPVVLGTGCSIDPEAQIGPYAVLGNGCRIGAGAKVQNSVLWNDIQVEANATVSGSVLADGVTVGNGETIENESIIQLSG